MSEATIQSNTVKNGDLIKENQDCLSVYVRDLVYNEDNKFTVTDNLKGFIGVYDGHDRMTGRVASSFAKKYIDNYIDNNWENINSDFHGEMNKMFSQLRQELKSELVNYMERNDFETRIVEVDHPENKDLSYIEYKDKNSSLWKLIGGGTTISLVFFLENGDMYNVHLGDSECISFNNDDSSNSGTYNIITRDHSAESLEEFKRIIDNYEKEKRGLFIYDEFTPFKKDPPVFSISNDGESKITKNNAMDYYKKGYKLYQKNIEKQWASIFSSPNKKSKLAMTASMGDYYLLQFGLRFSPEIVKIDSKNISSIVLASDGLWDNWCKNNLKDTYFSLVSQNKSDKEIFNNIYTQTTKKAVTNFGKSSDDITVIMVIF